MSIIDCQIHQPRLRDGGCFLPFPPVYFRALWTVTDKPSYNWKPVTSTGKNLFVFSTMAQGIL
jgi:hypothetical protein